MNKIIILFVSLILLLTLSSCNKKIEKDYPLLQGTDCIMEYTLLENAFDLLNEDKAILMFGFKECPWCKYAIRYVNDEAKNAGYKKVYYLDIYELRKETNSSHDSYIRLYEKIKNDIGSPEKIIAPTVIVIRNGAIASYHTGTVSSHDIIDGVLPPLSNEQIEELRSIYKKMFE